MRTTINIADDALLAGKNVAQRERISLGEAMQEAPLRGRFALLPVRDEVVTPQHVRDLMEREGI